MPYPIIHKPCGCWTALYENPLTPHTPFLASYWTRFDGTHPIENTPFIETCDGCLGRIDSLKDIRAAPVYISSYNPRMLFKMRFMMTCLEAASFGGEPVMAEKIRLRLLGYSLDEIDAAEKMTGFARIVPVYVRESGKRVMA